MNIKILSAAVASLIISSSSFAAEGKVADKMPTDAEITKIVGTTNEGEIELAKLAKQKTKNEEVKKFADHIITEHTSNNKNSMQLVRKLNLKPEKNEKSEEIKKDGETAMNKIKEMEGKEFDKAYMDSQVTIHQKVLDDLDSMLIPAAKNPELKALLENTKNSVTKHLDMAKKIQTLLL